MSKFYYHIKATNSENVAEIDATDEADALAKANDIYAPDNPITGRPHKGIDITIIDKDTYESEKARIAEDRINEANS